MIHKLTVATLVIVACAASLPAVHSTSDYESESTTVTYVESSVDVDTTQTDKFVSINADINLNRNPWLAFGSYGSAPWLGSALKLGGLWGLINELYGNQLWGVGNGLYGDGLWGVGNGINGNGLWGVGVGLNGNGLWGAGDALNIGTFVNSVYGNGLENGPILYGGAPNVLTDASYGGALDLRAVLYLLYGGGPLVNWYNVAPGPLVNGLYGGALRGEAANIGIYGGVAPGPLFYEFRDGRWFINRNPDINIADGKGAYDVSETITAAEITKTTVTADDTAESSYE